MKIKKGHKTECTKEQRETTEPVNNCWVNMKAELKQTSPNMSVVMPLTYKISCYGDDLMREYTEALDAGSDGTINGLQVDTALRQNQLLEEMLLLCLLIHQHIDVEYSLELLETLMFLFSDSLNRAAQPT